MKKLLSFIIVIAFSLCIVNTCNALVPFSIDKAAYVCSEKPFMMYIGDVMIEKLDFYIDLSENSCAWKYPSGQESLLIATFYYEPITKTVITDIYSPYRPWDLEFIKLKNGQWGFTGDIPEHRDNRKYIRKITPKGFHAVNDYFNSSGNRYPLSVLKKVGEYIDLDSFPTID